VKNQDQDRFLYWPLILTVIWPAIFVLTWAGPFVLVVLFVPALILILWLASGVFALITCVAWVRERSWRRLVSSLILPLSVLVAALNPAFVWQAGRTGGDYVHLFAMYPWYMQEISALPAYRRRFVVFDWGGFFSRGYGVVYDESDEIGSSHPSEAWKERADRSGVIGFGYPRAIGHFYFIDLH
jgi:hypothetical protein